MRRTTGSKGRRCPPNVTQVTRERTYWCVMWWGLRAPSPCPKVTWWHEGYVPHLGHGRVVDKSRLGWRSKRNPPRLSEEAPHSHRLLHYLGVNPCHTVHSMGPNHTQVCHVDSLAVPFLNHRHPPQAVHIPRKQGSHVLEPRTQEKTG